MKETIQSGAKYHGMLVVSDNDMITPRGKYILESNDSYHSVVLRHYDEKMREDRRSIEVNLLSGMKNGSMTAANCTGAIKREVGIRSMLISESVVSKIEQLITK